MLASTLQRVQIVTPVVLFSCISSDGMIPILPQDINQMDVINFYKQVVDNLEMRSGHHEAWHTHKRDTSVCWICDLVEVSKLVLSEMDRYITKSALDIEDSLIDQEFNSEGETVNTNVDEEIVNGSCEDTS